MTVDSVLRGPRSDTRMRYRAGDSMKPIDEKFHCAAASVAARAIALLLVPLIMLASAACKDNKAGDQRLQTIRTGVENASLTADVEELKTGVLAAQRASAELGLRIISMQNDLTALRRVIESAPATQPSATLPSDSTTLPARVPAP